MTPSPPSRFRGALAATDLRLAALLQRRAALQGRRGTGADGADGGFSLLETVVAISLIVVVMAAFGVFFVNSVAFTSLQRATQAATAIANSQLEIIRALPASDLIKGRTSAAVGAQVTAAPVPVRTSLAGMTVGNGAAVDPATATATPTLPTTPVTQTLNGITYSTTTYLGHCGLPAGVTRDAGCTPSTVPTGYIRAVVAVTWSQNKCPAAGCSYVTSTLLSTGDDPLFNLNQTPPAAPALTNPGPQTSAVGDDVNLVVASSAVPTYRINLTSGVLPAGLALDTATGVITGRPVTVAPATTLTLTLVDGFGRTATQTFTWTIVAPLSVETPPGQSGVIGTPVTSLTVRAAGGTAPYTWSDPNGTLPPGLSLATSSDTGVVSGTPTTYGTYPVVLQVTDAAGRTSSATFSWTIDYPPFAATNPGPQSATAGTADTLQLTVTGGSGSFAWTGGTTLPAGLTLTPAGLISGTPTIVGTTSVALTATDTVTKVARPVAFSWTVYGKPSVTAPGPQQSTVGSAVSVQVGANCPNSPCTFRLDNAPAALGISSTGLITGTVTSNPQVFGAVTFTMTDSAGASVTSSAFSWTVISSTPTAPQAVSVTEADGALTVSWTPPTSGATPTSYTVTLNPGGATCTTSGTNCSIAGLTNGVVYSATVAATNSGGTSAPSTGAQGIPYPAVLSAASGLTLWLDGTDPGVFLTAANCTGPAAPASTKIGCWKDKSGANRSFSQAVTGNQPVVGTWNGLQAASFTDTSDVLNAVNAGSYQTVFTAANILNSGTAARWVNVFGQVNTDYNVRLGTYGERSAPNANDWATGTGTPPLNWINSVQGVNGSPPGPMITTDQASAVRTFTASVSNTVFTDRALVGQVGDIITFNRVLTAAERRSVEEYLGRKWGVVIAPTAPTVTSATVTGNGSVAVSWTAPASNGGAAVTGYRVTASPGTAPNIPTCSTTGATTCTVSGLSRNTNYTFTVAAINAAGAGPSSAPSAVVRP
ncbi:putative Ig domain-containing protein [Nakamurella deserti]|uniref:putative Ig domain-containing protein n=1 Tax=Nakamurella deserti TaxID=2164074 RepID=UPI000DBE4F55|nr:putative Ig domain-containing protein [Nakamurella deserti]